MSVDNTASRESESEIESLPRTAYAPFDPDVDLYFYSRTTLEFGSAVPLEDLDWPV
jgi:hypothetical protein